MCMNLIKAYADTDTTWSTVAYAETAATPHPDISLLKIVAQKAE